MIKLYKCNYNGRVWKKKCRHVHKNFYDYSTAEYKGSDRKIEIICPQHGKFVQQARHHLSGSGCPKCHHSNLHKIFSSTKKEFITKASQIHHDRYDYSCVRYYNWKTRVKIICKIHGAFLQFPTHHLQESGCPKCAGVACLSTNEFIQNAKKIHNSTYDYSITEYKSAHKNVKIICKRHGTFLQTPSNHVNGKQGCPFCTHLISRKETAFLDHVGIAKRHFRLPEWKQKIVDGYDSTSNIIYEFLGDYWHGNPKVFKNDDINKDTKKTYGELYQKTFKILLKIKSLGYVVKYAWENDWDKFQKGKTDFVKIKTL